MRKVEEASLKYCHKRDWGQQKRQAANVNQDGGTGKPEILSWNRNGYNRRGKLQS